MQTIADIRRDYKLKHLDEQQVSPDAMKQFESWWNEAVNSNIDEVNAMTLATSDKNGSPAARIVLLKGYTENGFIFFTNYDSHKGKQLSENPKASLVFFWKELERQIRITGSVEKISAEESDAYFNSRPQMSKIGAWASPQSTVIADRNIIENRFQSLTEKFADQPVDRPEHWGGYIVHPSSIEFWQGRPSRLHDRILYIKQNNSWKIERLAP